MILKNPIMTPPGKEPTCQCRRYKRHGFDPSVEKIPWRRKQQPTPVFLPGESHGQKSLEAYGSWGLTQVSRHAWSFSVFPKRKFWLQLCEFVFFNFANMYIYIYIYIYICFMRGQLFYNRCQSQVYRLFFLGLGEFAFRNKELMNLQLKLNTDPGTQIFGFTVVNH